MDLSLISDLFLLTHPFSKVPSPFPTPGCVLCIHFPILVVVEDTICPKAFANPGIESLPPPVAAKSCWWDLEGRIFRDGEQCTHSVAVLCHWLFPISSGFAGVIQDRLLSLWLKPFFEALWGGFGNDSIPCCPFQGVDAETRVPSMAEGWQTGSSLGSSPSSAWGQS